VTKAVGACDLMIGLARTQAHRQKHSQVCRSGYSDSLIDYNFKGNVFSLGLSLLDF